MQEMQQANVPITAPEDEDEAEALFQQALTTIELQQEEIQVKY